MSRIAISFAVVIAWAAISMVGARLFLPQGRSITDLISKGVAWNILAAGLFVFVAARLLRWRDLGLQAPNPLSSVRLAWFPLAFLSVLLLGAVLKGLPPPGTMAIVLLNTLIVGFSEEMAFRGVLFQGLRSRLHLWPAMILVSALFGALHVLNVFVLGRLALATVQAVAASMTGFMLVALRVRTGSLWVPIVVHGLWDFGAFTLAGEAPPPDALDKVPLWAIVVIPLLLASPNFLYAAYLLRRTANERPLVAG